ncbi:DUF861 domain-containing protein [Nocardioides eburneiflavus]|uniref:DUF861 domain-containing protein n=1 Tax=Nocardioides eburneiflavus TaxID=2518372 RepID=A0A4Z1CLD9_9ACTN|nr:cupin domain-containing protein [Nocardioides eburneiflavus]TGN65770.1 DUF861 domain-containing protein [Nocardioides eburneiflavus]
MSMDALQPREQDGPRLLAANVFTMTLRGESQPGTWIDGGWPTARIELLAQLGETNTSVWEVTEGVVADIENDECLIVLAGAGVLRFENGEEITLKSGVCVRLRAGDRTEWTLRTPLRALTIAGR